MHDNQSIHDDTSRDAERFEREQLAQDADRNRITCTDQKSERHLKDIVDNAIDDGTVQVIPEDQLYYFAPADLRFKEQTNLAYSILGWNAANDSDE